MTDLAVLEAPGELQPRLLRFSSDGTLLAFNTLTNHLVHLWNLRLIRERLASMELDWDLPAYPPETTTGDSEPLQVEINVGSSPRQSPAKSLK